MYQFTAKKITKPTMQAIDTTEMEAQHDVTWAAVLAEQAQANRLLRKLQDNLQEIDNALAEWPEN